jgi:hypothetical protein
LEAIEKKQLLAIERIEISYSILSTQSQFQGVLQKLATAINVQLLIERDQKLPFVGFKGFDTAERADKLFLYGPSGCGKSRSIFEIVKSKITNFEKVYILNPRNTIGKDSGRISLHQLVNDIGENDAIVWDNFPDDLMKRDADTAKEVLEVISSKNIKGLFIALKPRYLEPYRGLVSRIPEFYNCEVFYDKVRFRDIVKLYGTAIPMFKEIYQRFTEDELGRISEILWEKEPTPLTIFDYYKGLLQELDNNEIGTSSAGNLISRVEDKQASSYLGSSIIGTDYARKLLRRSDYYQHQYGLITNMEERRMDKEFLCTLKLCYELGLNRTLSSLEGLQNGIFESKPPSEPLMRLSNWIYLSGSNYAMHDVPRDAINFDDYVRLRVLTYLIHDFDSLISGMHDNQINAFGIFLGKNINVIPQEYSSSSSASALSMSSDHPLLLPDNIYRYMKSNNLFEFSLGQGVGEVFPSLDAKFQQEIIKTVKKGLDIEFIRGLSSGLGYNFPSLDRVQQKNLLRMVNPAGVPFARFFGESVGRVFKYLSKEFHEQVFELMNRNGQFADGIGMGVGYALPNLDKQLQDDFLRRARTHADLTRGLGYGHALNYLSLDKDLQEEINKKIMTDGEFAKGLGMGFGFIFKVLPDEFRRKIFEVSDINPKFAFGLGIYLELVISSLDLQLQKEILEVTRKNSEFAFGAGVGLSYLFGYQSKEYQNQLFEKAERESHFGFGFGMGFGFLFKNFPKEIQNIILEKAERNSEFAKGFGSGFDYIFPHLPKEYQNQLFEKAERNSEFAKGLATGFGYTFFLLEGELQNIILEKAGRNSEFAFGFGYGLGYVFTYLPEEYVDKIHSLIEKNNRFAQGLASGIGYTFPYLSKEYQNQLFEKAERNSEFAKGLGYGLGHIFQYLSSSFQKELLAKISSSQVLSYPWTDGTFMGGLGVGLGYAIMYLPSGIQKDLFCLAAKNSELAIGLGEGIGRIYPYAKDLVEKILLEVNVTEVIIKDDEGGFSRGFGRGIGQIFKYLPKDIHERAFGQAIQDVQFAIGLGEGIGNMFNYFDKGVQDEFFAKAQTNNSFSKGLGGGLASLFTYLSDDERESIMSKIVSANGEFSRGFGRGIGQIFKYLPTAIQNKFLNKILKNNPQFAIGLGVGFGCRFRYWAFDPSASSIFDLLGKNAQFDIGLNQGIVEHLTCLDSQTRNKILKIVDQNQALLKHYNKQNYDHSQDEKLISKKKNNTVNFKNRILHLIRSLAPNKTSSGDISVSVSMKDNGQEILDLPKRVDADAKKVQITFSIDDIILQTIRGDAEREGMSINAKVNSILSRHSSCYRYGDRDHSLIMPSAIMREILDNMDEQLILNEYRNIIFEYIPFILIENAISPITLENWITHACNTTMVFTGLIQSFSCNVDEGGILNLVFAHSYGPKWSRMLDTILSQFINDVLKYRTSSSIISNSVVIRILEKSNNQ